METTVPGNCIYLKNADPDEIPHLIANGVPYVKVMVDFLKKIKLGADPDQKKKQFDRGLPVCYSDN